MLGEATHRHLEFGAHHQLNESPVMVLHLGPNFSASIETGGSAPVQLILDGRNPNTALIALGYLRSILPSFNRTLAAEQGRTPPTWLKIRAW